MTEKKTFSVRIPVELYKKLEDIAWKGRKYKSDVIIRALQLYLKDLK